MPAAIKRVAVDRRDRGSAADPKPHPNPAYARRCSEPACRAKHPCLKTGVCGRCKAARRAVARWRKEALAGTQHGGPPERVALYAERAARGLPLFD